MHPNHFPHPLILKSDKSMGPPLFMASCVVFRSKNERSLVRRELGVCGRAIFHSCLHCRRGFYIPAKVFDSKVTQGTGELVHFGNPEQKHSYDHLNCSR